MKHRYWLRSAILIVSLLIVGWLLEVTHFGARLDQAWIDSAVRGKGATGELIYIGAAGLATALGMPRQIISFLAGYAFGALAGTILAVLATLVGCVMAFAYSRWLARALVAKHFGPRVRRMDDFIGANPLATVLLIRLFPVGNNLVTNLVAGVTRVRAVPFLLGSALGYVPQSLVFALMGSGVRIDPIPRVGLAIVLFIASSAIGVWLYHRQRNGRSWGEQLQAGSTPDKTVVSGE